MMDLLLANDTGHARQIGHLICNFFCLLPGGALHDPPKDALIFT